jgi:IS30 family transposase
LEASAELRDAVNEVLVKKWSPEQIAHRLKEDHPEEPELRVSHETIYQCLYLQARGEPRTQLEPAPRSGRTWRVSHSRATLTRGKIKDMVNIQ